MKPARKPEPSTKDGVPEGLKPFLDDLARIIAAAVLREINPSTPNTEVARDPS